VSAYSENAFWSRVDKHGPVHPVVGRCWVWTGTKAGAYGQFKSRGEAFRAHRYSYALHHGSIPDGMSVLHRCDNPICVNPSHLFLGTQADNCADCYKKGRYAKGSANARAKLTDEIVAYMREVYVPASREFGAAALAREFGVRELAVRLALKGRTWGHVQ
jgi:hypothetical protein